MNDQPSTDYFIADPTTLTPASTTLINPRHSRPMDVHRWSEHREVLTLVESLWNQGFTDFESKPGGRPPKTSCRQQLRVLIADLYVAWKNDPTRSIGVHMKNGAWNTSSRYNAIGLSRKIPVLIRRLAELGYIELSPGSFDYPGASTNRTSRIIAAEPLRQSFREARFGPEHIIRFPAIETIILRDADKQMVEYEDTPETVQMRADLVAYNTLIQGAFIDVPDQVEPHIDRPIKKGPRQGEVDRTAICGLDNHVRRVFNRERWDYGGRFYGGWWQSAGSDFRKKIHIDGNPTVEVDFQAVHISMLSALAGVVTEGDPYTLEAGLVPGVEAIAQRKLIKKLVLVGLNAQDKASACKAFRNGSSTGSTQKSMKDAELLNLLDMFTVKHPHLKPDLCSDKGIELMRLDSDIASQVINTFTSQCIPVLCIHDSFIVDYRYSRMLKQVMTDASEAVVGRPINVTSNFLGLDEVERNRPGMVDDYRALRHLEPCPQYLTRQQLHEERMAYLRELEQR